MIPARMYEATEADPAASAHCFASGPKIVTSATVKMPVLTIGARIAARRIPSHIFFFPAAAAASPATRPAASPLTMHTVIVATGFISSIMVLPAPAAPVTT